MSGALSTLIRGAGLLLFVLALALIAIFWPFGGGLAQNLFVDSLSGAAQAGSVARSWPIEQLWHRMTAERPVEKPVEKPVDEPARAFELPRIENAACRVFVVPRSGIVARKDRPMQATPPRVIAPIPARSDRATEAQKIPGNSRFVLRQYSA